MKKVHENKNRHFEKIRIQYLDENKIDKLDEMEYHKYM